MWMRYSGTVFRRYPKFLCWLLAVPIQRNKKEPAAANEAVLNKVICAFRVASCSLIRKTENLAGT